VERRRFTALDLDDFVYGIHAVDEALAAGERLRAIHIAADRVKDSALRPLLAKAREANVPVRYQQRAFFESVPFRAHQGVIGIAPPFPYASLHDILARSRAGGATRLIVVLDHLTDPHNVGAIIRTAEAAGADGVILPARRSAGVNATVRKAAAGAAVHLPIARVANIAAAIREMKKAGVWVAGADPSAEAVESHRADFNRDLALVIGSEGSGLSPLVKRECDYLIKLPIRGRVASLNASVAAGILIYEALRQRDCSLRP
jgi:23S rRNA (guanosine2251-2'-O)-methyltransferase